LRRSVIHERRAPQPTMPLRLFSSRGRSGAYAARLLFLGAIAPFWLFTTQRLQAHGYTPSKPAWPSWTSRCRVRQRRAPGGGGVTKLAHPDRRLAGPVLVAVSAAADASGALHGGTLLAHRIAASLTAGAVLLALALLIALAVRPRRRVSARSPASAPTAATGVAAPEAAEALVER
jgi:hypothetical protein